jgi:hypothetical protein
VGWVDRLGGVLADAALGAFFLSSAVALAMVACRQPARRCVLARAGLCAVVLLWPLVLIRPAARWHIIDQADALVPRFLRNASSKGDLEPAPRSPSRSVGESDDGDAFARSAGRALTLIYFGVCAAGLANLALGWAAAAWLRRSARCPDAAALATYVSMPYVGSHGLPRPDLLVAPRIGRPVLVGLARTAILVPEWYDSPDFSSELRLSLLHELAHAERADPAFGVVGTFAQTVWFFLPQIWWIRGQMRLDQEFLADHQASSGFGHSTAYAASLVGLAEPSGREPSGPSAVSPNPARARSGVSALFFRVLMLVRCPFPFETQAPAWWRWLLPSLVGGAALAVSMLSLRPDPSHAAEATRPNSAPSAHGSFHVARLFTDQTEPDSASPNEGPYVLPILLPPRFDLSLEVWGTAPDLRKIRILGLQMEPEKGVPAGWHQVQIHHEAIGTTVRLDGAFVPFRAATAWPRRLTLHVPPDQAGRFRNLSLTW